MLWKFIDFKLGAVAMRKVEVVVDVMGKKGEALARNGLGAVMSDAHGNICLA